MIVVVMGVSGSGKSLIGRRLAAALGLPFHDADDYHPRENVRKMAAGVPLTDADRTPWLRALADRLRDWEAEGGAVLACSALRERYRRALTPLGTDVRLVYLRGTRALLLERLRTREHFFPAVLLDSQLTTLEAPTDALVVDAAERPEALVRQIVARLRSAGPPNP